jgi:mevalonate kinase
VFSFLLSIFCASSKALSGLAISVATQLPLSSGLGSSAAFSVSLAQGFWHLNRTMDTAAAAAAAAAAAGSALHDSHEPAALSHDELALINQWAFEGERMMHGNPSGVDNTVSSFGGALAFRRGMAPVPLREVRNFRILVVDTRTARDTKRLVAGVAARLEKHPNIMVPLLDTLHQMAISIAQCVAPTHMQEIRALAAASSHSAVADHGADAAPSLSGMCLV